MNHFPMPIPLPWIEAAILVSLLGALWVACIKDAQSAARWSLAFASASLACTILGAAGYFCTHLTDASQTWSFEAFVLARPVFSVDDVNVLLLPTVALVHLMTALATPRTKMPRFSFTWLLGLGAIRLATFACIDPWVLVGLLTIGTLPPYLELVNRGKPTRVYLIHMGLFVFLLVVGWALMDSSVASERGWAALPLLAAILVRSGAVPTHCWLTDYFEHGTFGTALLIAAPIVGVYATVRLVLPTAPIWVLHSLGLVSLVTAVYAAGMALVQREARRFFAFLFLSHASLVLVGLELSTSLSLTGALCLWFSVALSLTGLGLTLRALEARFGRMSLTKYHGLYRHSPTLAVFFLITGLASVGFPGTLGFVSTELLVDGAIKANLYVGLAVVLTAAINSIGVVRVYLLLFTGTDHAATVPLHITPRERLAVLTLAALILGGGLFPQPGIATGNNAAEAILKSRQHVSDEPAPIPH